MQVPRAGLHDWRRHVVEVRLLMPADAEQWWQLRLEALEREPRAFGASPEEHRRRTIDDTRARLSPTDDAFVLGAFVDGRLCGTVGLYREQGIKTRHKAMIWTMYVDPACRGRGIGRQLMEALIVRARTIPGIEQIGLAVSLTQPAARTLYSSLGFQLWGLEHGALKVGDDYIDEQHMVLVLGRSSVGSRRF